MHEALSIRRKGDGPFQESAEGFRARAHLSAVKPPVLVGICAVALVVAILVIQGFWGTLTGGGFEVAKQEGGGASYGAGPEGSGDAESGGGADEAASDAATNMVFIHVGGAVTSPGVYGVAEGSRVQAAIDAAGGLREDAVPKAVNLARVVVDGEQIIVPTPNEVNSEGIAPMPGLSASGGKVNINTASLGDLVTLPGIGEVTAEKILKHRESSGPFSSPEDIMGVSGIGKKKYESIADLICV